VENRAKVLALAHALEAHKTLSGEDVLAVMSGSKGPLVDGAPYQVAGNIEQIEKYHQSALVAHMEHRSPDLPLPIF
jgi:hypothetical protein